MPGNARAKNAAKDSQGAPFHSSLNVNGKNSSGQMPRVALLDVTEDSTPLCPPEGLQHQQHLKNRVVYLPCVALLTLRPVA